MISFVARLPAIFILACVLASCGMAPLSFLEVGPLSRVDPHLYPVRVVSVDGSIQFSRSIPVEPGPRWLVVEAAPPRGSRLGVQKSFAFLVEPCTRYYLAAHKPSPLLQEWSLVVSPERVTPCDPQEELKKSTRGSSAFKAPSAASAAK
jgi:hypothetical protein